MLDNTASTFRLKNYVTYNTHLKNSRVPLKSRVVTGTNIHQPFFPASIPVMESILLPQRSRDQLLQRGMREPSSCLRNQDQKLQTGITPSQHSMFSIKGSATVTGNKMSQTAITRELPAGKKLARLIWLVRVKIAWYCSHLPERYRRNAFVLFISQESCSNSFSGSYCFGERDLKLLFHFPRSEVMEVELLIYT